MQPVAVVTDSAADLTPAQVQQYGITVVPLIVRFGMETFLDGVMTVDEFWAKTLSGGDHPASSQPPVGAFEEAFRPWVNQGYHVITVTVTSKHSGTFNSASVAAQSFPGRVTVFDSLGLSYVQAYQAIRATQMAKEGRSAQEIVAALESIRSRTCIFIQLDTIEYLRRGGRANQTMPALIKLVRFLSIKPLLSMPDGQLKPFGATRSLDKGMARISEEVGKHCPAEMIAVLHTRLPAQARPFAQRLAAQHNYPLSELAIAEVGPVLSSHAGPGVIAAGVVARA